MDAVIQLGIIIGGVVLAFVAFGFLIMGCGMLVEKLWDISDNFDTGSVSPFSFRRIIIIGLFMDALFFLHLPNTFLIILIAVVINCVLLYVKEKHRDRYGKKNLICGVVIFLIAPILWIIIVVAFLISSLGGSNETKTYTINRNGEIDNCSNGTYNSTGQSTDDEVRFEEKFDPVLGKYYADGHGNIKDADGNAVNPWDKPYWMP